MRVDNKLKNRLEYILRTPKERRKLKKMLLSYQKNLKKEWPRLSDPSSGYTKANRKLITSLAEFSTKCLETIDRLDQNAGVTDKN